MQPRKSTSNLGLLAQSVHDYEDQIPTRGVDARIREDWVQDQPDFDSYSALQNAPQNLEEEAELDLGWQAHFCGLLNSHQRTCLQSSDAGDVAWKGSQICTRK